MDDNDSTQSMGLDYVTQDGCLPYWWGSEEIAMDWTDYGPQTLPGLTDRRTDDADGA